MVFKKTGDANPVKIVIPADISTDDTARKLKELTNQASKTEEAKAVVETK